MSQVNSIGPIAPAEHRTRTAIAEAAERTGADFDYLLAQAKLESSLDPHAKARTSSASGLYQFINSTWLSVLDRHGEQLGFGREAAAIDTHGGRARITDPSQRADIMALRFDPQASALMAGALAQDNRAALLPVLGREPEPNELYLAHFLGSAGASRFLSEMQRNPQASAAAIMPRAAAANRAIFYHSSGAPRSLQNVHSLIADKVTNAMRGAGPQPTFRAPTGFAQASNDQSTQPTRPGRSAPPGGFAPFLSMPPSMNMPALPARSSPPPMAETVRAAFAVGGPDNSSAAQAHVRRAYERLGAFGL